MQPGRSIAGLKAESILRGQLGVDLERSYADRAFFSDHLHQAAGRHGKMARHVLLQPASSVIHQRIYVECEAGQFRVRPPIPQAGFDRGILDRVHGDVLGFNYAESLSGMMSTAAIFR
jgi:hypothetical protein